ncbi:MAG: hypothetical protein K1X88_12625 [Nannocystaceae bacterium]|nr:hypothetical protein [Nannocystaceae bacterium]
MVATRRLPSGDATPWTGFRVERSEALLRLRARPGRGRWDWTLTLARALLSLADAWQVRLTQGAVGEHDVVGIAITGDPALLHELPPESLLDQALEPDPGAGDYALPRRRLRFMRLLGRAVNEALAFAPVAVQLRVLDRTVEFTPSAKGPDPWRESAPTFAPPHDPVVVALNVTIERNFQRTIDKLLGRDGCWAIAELVRSHVPGATFTPGGGVLRSLPTSEFVQLGDQGWLWPRPHMPRLALLLDGVAGPTAIASALRGFGVYVDPLRGWISAPRLRLTFDEHAVVHDDALAALAAWCLDTLAHGEFVVVANVPNLFDVTSWDRTRFDRAFKGLRCKQGLDRLFTVSGGPVSADDLAACVAQGRAVPYVWRHEVAHTPRELAPITISLWPSELDLLRAAFPNLQLHPVAAYRLDDAQADFGTLVKGSYPELFLGLAVTDTDPPYRIEVSAYVHRNAASQRGRVLVGSPPVQLGASEDDSLAIPGVTVVGRIPESGHHERFSADVVVAALHATAGHARGRLPELVAHVRAQPHGGPIADALAALTLAPVAPSPTRRQVRRVAPPLFALEIADPTTSGTLELMDPEQPSAVEVRVDAGQAQDLRLPEPLSAIGGRLWLRGHEAAVWRDAILLSHANRFVAQAVLARVLATPGSDRRRALAAFVQRCAPPRRWATTDPDAPPLGLPAEPSQWLPALVSHALQRPLQITESSGTAAWPVGVLGDRDTPRLVLDPRHTLLCATRAANATPATFVRAAMMIVAHTCAQLRIPARGPLQRLQALLPPPA